MVVNISTVQHGLLHVLVSVRGLLICDWRGVHDLLYLFEPDDSGQWRASRLVLKLGHLYIEFSNSTFCNCSHCKALRFSKSARVM